MDNIYIMQHSPERWVIDGEHGRETFPPTLNDEQAEWLYRTKRYGEAMRDFLDDCREARHYGEKEPTLDMYLPLWIEAVWGSEDKEA